MRQERIDERSLHRAWRGMHRHPRRFVDDDEVLVLEHDLERNSFRLRRRGLGRRQGQGVAPSRARLVLRVRHRKAVHAELACAYEPLNSRARQIRPQLRQPCVDAFARIGRRDRLANLAAAIFFLVRGHRRLQ